MRFLQNKTLTLACLLLLGFFYRLVLAFHTESSLIWDMQGYNDLAHAVLNGGFAASCCNHGPGYPVFLAVIYSLFSPDNLFAVRLVQITLDLLSAFFVYKTAKQFFGEQPARLSFLLFLFNPFTASYTGLRLGETLLVFTVSAMAFLLTRKDLHRSRLIWLILGSLLALLTATKIAYYFFVLLVGLIFLLTLPGRKQLLTFAMVFFIGFISVSAYGLISNYVTYKKLTFIPPYRTTGGLLYASFSLGRYPELAGDFTNPGVSSEYSRVTNEYYQYVNNNPAGLTDYDMKYKTLFFERLKTDWPVFVANTARNIVLMWDKRFLSPYSDPWYPKDTLPLRILNIGYVLAFVVGIHAFIMKKARKIFTPFFVFSTVFFLYISITLGMVTNETRLTIPYYPILMMWAGYGIHTALVRLRSLCPQFRIEEDCSDEEYPPCHN